MSDMPQTETMPSLFELYHADETAWLELMSVAASTGDVAALDLEHLAEYLSDMARRDRREVTRRLIVLLAHLLKWERQPDHRTRSWELTIREQREELQELLESGTLHNHAEQELPKAFEKAVRRVAVETELPETAFPTECPFTLDSILND